jgi:hypothetical protein
MADMPKKQLTRQPGLPTPQSTVLPPLESSGRRTKKNREKEKEVLENFSILKIHGEITREERNGDVVIEHLYTNQAEK